MEGQDLSVALSLNEAFAPHQSLDFWYDLLRDIAEAISLTPCLPPLIYQFPTDHIPTEDGVSGIMLVVQSHIAFHYWPSTMFLHFTISSCKEFSERRVLDLMFDNLPIETYQMRKSLWL